MKKIAQIASIGALVSITGVAFALPATASAYHCGGYGWGGYYPYRYATPYYGYGYGYGAAATYGAGFANNPYNPYDNPYVPYR
jgi:hypothetical protein